ncbi:MAG: tol-pal system protein YbgF [Xanthobacteraceae bacterium]|nr:tol-pal system protein YbgF [Xanthobacteraceae bacterium]
MTRMSLRALFPALTLLVLAGGSVASAQQNNGLLDRIFGNEDAQQQPAQSGRTAQADPANLNQRLDRLEGQLRQLTGAVEQLTFRNQQLEQQLQRQQQDTEFRFEELGGKGKPRTAQPGAPAPTVRQPTAGTPPVAAPGLAPGPAPLAPPAQPGRRSDIFDPNQRPDAPGAPRTLGSPDSRPSAPMVAQGNPQGDIGQIIDDSEPMVGAPGGRAPGSPLDLSTMSRRPGSDPTMTASAEPLQADGQLPAPPPRNPNATGGRMAAVAPAGNTPKDQYDLAYGYVLRKDYALAEQGFRDFMKSNPGDRLAPEAQYWLGESMFQRQRYRDAAEAFLTVSTKFETTAKAPDALLRLGQSLAALGEKEAACASLGEVKRKFPKASAGVKKSVEQEQKRVAC